MKRNFTGIIFLIFTIAWMILIFFFSSQSGSESSGLSNKITSVVIKIFVPKYNTYSLEEKDYIFSNFSYFIRKCAHFFIYSILFLFSYICFYMFFKKWYIINIGPLVISLIYAITDEIHQSFSINRGPAVKDVIIDFLGALMMLLLINVFLSLKRNFKKR